MRTRRVIVIALLFVFACFFVWWLWLRSATKPEVKPTASAAITKTGGGSTAAANPTPPGTSAAKPDLKTQLQELMNDANRPISFFGKVVDQDGNLLSGVKVTLQIRYTKSVGPAGIGDTFDYPVLMTGEDGRFTLKGARGALLAVKALEKSGYEPSVKALRSSYWYWREPKDAFHPNADQPEVFRMWKRAGAEPQVRKGISAGLHYDGTTATFDLLTGSLGDSGGDLRVTLVRDPQQIKYGQRNYEWTLTVESLSGGLIVSNDEQMYRAPADGYQSRLVVHMAANDPKWTDETSFNLYVKLRGNLYGRAEVKALVGSDRATTPFYITSFVNPSGSRNLEYDSKQSLVK